MKSDRIPESKNAVVTFPEGLVGFSEWKRFVLKSEDEGPIQVIESLDQPEVSFYVVAPDYVVGSYDIELSDADQAAIGLDNPCDATVLCTLTIRDEPFEVTANLAGPIVINRVTMLAKQLVLQDDRYGLRQPVWVETMGEG